VAESFERVHRSSLIGLGVVPLQILGASILRDLPVDGSETYDLVGLSSGLSTNLHATLVVRLENADPIDVPVVL